MTGAAKVSLKSLVGAPGPTAAPVQSTPRAPVEEGPRPRSARTRTHTRQIAGHFAVEVAQAFNVLAAEQDKDNQELLAEALTMLFKRYGKPVTVTVSRKRRRDA